MNTKLSPALPVKQDDSPMIGGVGHMPARNFNEAVRYLGAKSDRPYKPNGTSPRSTRVIKTERGIGIKYHNTVVVEYTPEGITLNSDNFRTVTTKARFNEALRELASISASVSQNQGIWYLHVAVKNTLWQRPISDRNPNYDNTLPTANYERDGAESNWYWRDMELTPGVPQYLSDQTIAYEDGVTISWDGEIINPPSPETLTRQLELVNLLRRYHKHVKTLCETDTLPAPNAGDCWICAMPDNRESSHMVAHLEELYVPGRLIYNAVNEYGSQFIQWTLQKLWNSQPISAWEREMITRDVPKLVDRYIKSRIGIAGWRMGS